MKFWQDASCRETDRRLLESTYDAVMTVYELQPKTEDGFTEETRVEIAVKVPCGVSYLSGGGAKDGSAATAEGTLKIFCTEEITVPAGAILHIQRDGKTIEAIRTGIARHYGTHQELIAVEQKL